MEPPTTLRILTEASGGLTSGYILDAIRTSGHRSVASDVVEDCHGRRLADDYLRVPYASDPTFWEQMTAALDASRIDVVFPSFDETLLGWAERRASLAQRGVHVIVSPPETVSVFQDKWSTYQHFRDHGLPTPRTSLSQDYPLVKPRWGRGGAGVRITSEPVPMEGMVSQEVLAGDEYTVDVFCNREGAPLYIVPRRRLRVVDGKSLDGHVVEQTAIRELVAALCRTIRMHGPVNVQCFVAPTGEVTLTEVNPRLAGGMALGMAATENWVGLAVDHFVHGRPCTPQPVRWGLKMMRYYAEVFVS